MMIDNPNRSPINNNVLGVTMSKMSQRESVFQAVLFVMNLKPDHKGFVKPTSEERKQIISLVAADLAEGRAEFSDEAKAKYDTLEKIKGYTNGMVSNWLRKDPRLNETGGKYETKNPGSRAGQGDEQLKNLKALQSMVTDPEQKKAVQAKIDERQAEVAKSKAKTVTIDINQIPEELRHLVPTAS
jgi:hypothetical protein